MSDEVDRVLAAVAADIEPDDDERAAVEDAVIALTERLEQAIDTLDFEADVLHVGSTARDTWASGERDIDLFVRFPPSTDREHLREAGLAVGRAVLTDGEANYAEHPYITGSFDGFDVDIVPCFAVDDASEARSAVDRTPFHTAYVRERLDGDTAAEVRLAKRFLAAFDAYGSNLKTRGFGGYLLELLLLEYGDFRRFLEAVAAWQLPVEIDLEAHAAATFDDELVVIDPTDPMRNVAAVVSRTNLARLQHYARTFLDDPSSDRFEATDPMPLDAPDLLRVLENRETTPIAVVFDRPDLIDDQLYPQVRKAHRGTVEGVERHGFDVFRSSAFVGSDEIVIFLECAVATLPTIERHRGPPVAIEDHARRFVEVYADREDVVGPFIEDGRYVVERQRRFRYVGSYLTDEAFLEISFGDHLDHAVAQTYRVLEGEDVVELIDGFGTDLAEHFDPDP